MNELSSHANSVTRCAFILRDQHGENARSIGSRKSTDLHVGTQREATVDWETVFGIEGIVDSTSVVRFSFCRKTRS